MKDRSTFQIQLYISIGILMGCFVLATFTKQRLFNNAGWIIYGLFWLIHPLCPRSWSYRDPDKVKLGCRIAGILAIVLGLITRFGV